MEPWFVKNTGFRERVASEDMAVFRRVCPKKAYPQGRVIFRSGDPATHLHVIVAGQVKLVTATGGGKERILAICGAEDFIGEAFLSRDRYRMDAVALVDCVTCPMSREQFVRVTEETATFALAFTEILADHLAHCRSALGTSYDSVGVRVVKTLLVQLEHFGTPLPDGWSVLALKLTQDELAAMVSATRVAVSNVFSELRGAHLVEGGRGQYRFDVAGLERWLEAR